MNIFHENTILTSIILAWSLACVISGAKIKESNKTLKESDTALTDIRISSRFTVMTIQIILSGQFHSLHVYTNEIILRPQNLFHQRR